MSLYGMNDEQEIRFFRLSTHLRSLGYFVPSESHEGQIDSWLDGIERKLSDLEERLIDINKAYKTRGRSKAARYHMTSNEHFDPGFGISLTHEQWQDNKAYSARLPRGAARWDAAFCSDA